MEKKIKTIEAFLAFAENQLDSLLEHDCEDYGLSEEEFKTKKQQLIEGCFATKKLLAQIFNPE